MANKVTVDRDRGMLGIYVEMSYCRTADAAVQPAVEKAIRRAVVEELDKSPEFKEAIRAAAIQRITDLLAR